MQFGESDDEPAFILHLLIDYITKVGQIVGRQKKTVLTKGLQKDRQSIDNTVKSRLNA